MTYQIPNSGWAIFPIPTSYVLPNLNQGTELLRIVPKAQLTPGDVMILYSTNTYLKGYLTQTKMSLHTRTSVVDVREVLLEAPLLKGVSGSWVVRDDQVCGHVVAVTGSGLSCCVVPMERTLEDIEAVLGKNVQFGRDSHKLEHQLLDFLQLTFLFHYNLRIQQIILMTFNP